MPRSRFSLTGTVFAMPVDEARGRSPSFLLLTMAPSSSLAPLIGPILDRFRHGRRWAIGTTVAMRAFLAWVLAGALVDDSAWLFPAALGALVASRSYAVASRRGPSPLPPSMSLVRANSRINIVGMIGMTLGGPWPGRSWIGPGWSLRLAFVIYVVATVLAIRLPAVVDSSRGGPRSTTGCPIRRQRRLPRRCETGSGSCRRWSATPCG